MAGGESERGTRARGKGGGRARPSAEMVGRFSGRARWSRLAHLFHRGEDVLDLVLVERVRGVAKGGPLAVLVVRPKAVDSEVSSARGQTRASERGKRAERKEVVRNHPSRQGRASAREEARRRRSKKCGRKIVVVVRRWITYGSFSHLCSSQKVPGQVKVYTK